MVCVCLHPTQHEPSCCVRVAFLGPSASQNGVINGGPWVLASPPKRPSLMNHRTGRTNWRLAWPFNPAQRFHHPLWIYSISLASPERQEASSFWPLTGLHVYPLVFFLPSMQRSTMHLGTASQDFKGVYPPNKHTHLIGLDVIEQALADAQQRQAHIGRADIAWKRWPSPEGWKKNHNHTQTHAANSPSSWECTPTHSLEAAVIFRGEEEKTGKLRRRRGGAGEVSGRWEWVANAGDRSSLVTRLACRYRITASPYYIHNATGNFLSPVWLRDPLPWLILLPPTIDRSYEEGLKATILHVSV